MVHVKKSGREKSLTKELSRIFLYITVKEYYKRLLRKRMDKKWSEQS